MSNIDHLLEAEVKWLKGVRNNVIQAAHGNPAPPVDETLLEGHLCVTRELVAFLTPQAKYDIGGDPNKGICLIRVSLSRFN